MGPERLRNKPSFTCQINLKKEKNEEKGGLDGGCPLIKLINGTNEILETPEI